MQSIRIILAGVATAAALGADLAPRLKAPGVPAPLAALEVVSPLRPGEREPFLTAESALVYDEAARQVLFAKEADTPRPIASITKVATAMVVLEGGQPLAEPVEIAEADVDTLRNSASHLPVGWVLPRRDLLHLALMCSDNRAAHALARTFPGGVEACVAAMNRMAVEFGLDRTHFADPTGLDARNLSTAQDLARLALAASKYPLIREFSTCPDYQPTSWARGRSRLFGNSNPLVHDPAWKIGLSKTGYITDSGFCLLMRPLVEERPVVIVLLGARSKDSRVGDARRIRRWLEGEKGSELASARSRPSNES